MEEEKKKHPGGRPTKYDPSICEKIIDYFDKPPFHVEYKKEYYNNGELKSEYPIHVANEYPTFQRFAFEIGVNVDTLHEWKEQHKEFSVAYTQAKELQESIWSINALQNLYNSQFAQFLGKNCFGYKDKQEIDMNGAVTIMEGDLQD